LRLSSFGDDDDLVAVFPDLTDPLADRLKVGKAGAGNVENLGHSLPFSPVFDKLCQNRSSSFSNFFEKKKPRLGRPVFGLLTILWDYLLGEILFKPKRAWRVNQK
jgi:hypothetical protein